MRLSPITSPPIDGSPSSRRPPRIPGVVRGWGMAVPPTVVTNADLEARLDTDDEWIRTRTGIRERRMGGSSNDLAIEAGKAALRCASVDAATVDLVVVATSTPDRVLPAAATSVQAALGTNGGAFDLNAACSGFVYALLCGFGFLAQGSRRVLVIGADVLTTLVDHSDRTTAVLFGDGAGAVVLEAPGADTLTGDPATPGPGPGLLGSDLGTDGTATHVLHCEHGAKIHMDGKEVFRRAVRATVSSSERALADAGVTAADIACFLPHGANARIVTAASERLGIEAGRVVTVLDRTGNTSAASVPMALAHAADEGRLQPGDLVLMCGFGAGMSWASAVVRWGAPS